MADTPEIPAAAVQAAAEVLFEHWRKTFAKGTRADNFTDEAREVLAAALPHLGDPTSRAVARGAAMADEVLARYAAREVDHD